MIRVAPLFLFILLFFAHTLVAQQFTISLGSFYQLAPDQRSAGYLDWQSVRAEPQLAGDTLYVLYRQQTPWRATAEFHYRGGGQAAVQLGWALGSKLSIQSGLGLRLYAFEMRSVSEYGLTESIPLDTLEDYIPSTFSPGTNLNSCTYYTNNYSDAGRPQPYPIYRVAELDIPLRIDYALIPGSLNLLAGAHLRSPLFSERTTELINLKRETLPNGDIACTYVKEKRINRTGDYLRDATLAGSLGIQLWLGRLGLELEGQKQFFNRFTQSERQNNPNSNYNFRPFEIGLKILYKL